MTRPPHVDVYTAVVDTTSSTGVKDLTLEYRLEQHHFKVWNRFLLRILQNALRREGLPNITDELPDDHRSVYPVLGVLAGYGALKIAKEYILREDSHYGHGLRLAMRYPEVANNELVADLCFVLGGLFYKDTEDLAHEIERYAFGWPDLLDLCQRADILPCGAEEGCDEQMDSVLMAVEEISGRGLPHCGHSSCLECGRHAAQSSTRLVNAEVQVRTFVRRPA